MEWHAIPRRHFLNGSCGVRGILAELVPTDDAVIADRVSDRSGHFGQLDGDYLGTEFARTTFEQSEIQDLPGFDTSDPTARLFYNQKRLHSAIGYVSPAEFEETFTVRKAA